MDVKGGIIIIHSPRGIIDIQIGLKMKSAILSLLLSISLMLCTISMARAENTHNLHQRMGHHGMVMFAVGADIYVSHLPLFSAPHDFQLIYRVKSANNNRILAMLAKDTLTILPAAFDLNRLVDGESFKISTQIFTGHFERGGTLSFQDKSFEFYQPIYKRSLSQVPQISKSQNKTFVLLDTKLPNAKLAVHHIQAAPSFDMIALISDYQCIKTKDVEFETIETTLPAATPLTKDLASQGLKQCGNVTTLYFETQDFAG
jgi:hypothetical protein